jgi:hypothetical protein
MRNPVRLVLSILPLIREDIRQVVRYSTTQLSSRANATLAKMPLSLVDEFGLGSFHLMTVFLAIMLYVYLRGSRRKSSFPTVNYDPKAWTKTSAKAQFTTHCRQLLLEGSRKV